MREGSDDDPESAARIVLGLPRIGAADVLTLLPPMYADCAAAAPDILEGALDAVWELRRRDPRAPNQYPDHPERVVADRLADLHVLPDPSFPHRILNRVRFWLEHSYEPDEPATPLFALAPLLAKEGTHVAGQDGRTLSMGSYLVSPAWARRLRDEIRQLLRRVGCSPDLRLASQAVRVLGDALHPVHGYFGNAVDAAHVTAWEDDDVETVGALTDIANAVPSAALRRLVRDQVAWSAARARSLRVRHAALALVTDLDNRAEDDLAEVLLHAWGAYEPSRRGLPLPTLEELEVEVDAERDREAELDQAQRDAEREAEVHATVTRTRQEDRERSDAVVAELVATGDPVTLVRILDGAAREVRAVNPNQVPGIWVVLRGIVQVASEMAGAMTRAVADLSSTALDGQLQLLMAAWLSHDQPEALEWLSPLGRFRRATRLAVAATFVEEGLITHGEGFGGIHREGLSDRAPDVRDAFLVACAPLLASQPASTVELLMGAEISAPAAVQVLALASGHDGETWGSSLGYVDDARAVLSLIDRAGWQDFTAQGTASGIARQHPTLVLDHLLHLHDTPQRVPHTIHGLADALNQQPAAFAEWLIDHRSDYGPASRVVHLATEGSMRREQADEIVARLTAFSGADLLGIGRLLDDVRLWPLRQPHLARQFLDRARTCGDDNVVQPTKELLRRAMQLRFFAWTNGHSQELATAKVLASECAARETDSGLKDLFDEAATGIERNMEDVRQSYEEDDDW